VDLCGFTHWKWWFIVDLPIKNGGSFHRFLYVYRKGNIDMGKSPIDPGQNSHGIPGIGPAWPWPSRSWWGSDSWWKSWTSRDLKVWKQLFGGFLSHGGTPISSIKWQDMTGCSIINHPASLGFPPMTQETSILSSLGSRSSDVCFVFLGEHVVWQVGKGLGLNDPF